MPLYWIRFTVRHLFIIIIILCFIGQKVVEDGCSIVWSAAEASGGPEDGELQPETRARGQLEPPHQAGDRGLEHEGTCRVRALARVYSPAAFERKTSKERIAAIITVIKTPSRGYYRNPRSSTLLFCSWSLYSAAFELEYDALKWTIHLFSVSREFAHKKARMENLQSAVGQEIGIKPTCKLNG